MECRAGANTANSANKVSAPREARFVTGFTKFCAVKAELETEAISAPELSKIEKNCAFLEEIMK